MSRFTEILLVSPLPDGKTWVTRRDFGYDIGEEGSEESIDIPIGFKTDFTSVPRPFWLVFPRWGKYGNAAVIHDYCYWDQTYSRRRSDEIFREGMEVLRVKGWQSFLIYWSVRLGGVFAWRSNRKLKEKKPNAKIFTFKSEKVSDLAEKIEEQGSETV